ncbi:MAG: choice-of-anchor L domain-containing protein [Bacteroidales bacterium]|nr:choice-of-anchor L domain-containing protein [Bacteroidales bacterium]
MKKNCYIPGLLLVILFFGIQKNGTSQYNFHVEACADSAAVIALFDSVFFSEVPPQTIANLTFYGDPSAVGYFRGGYFLGFDVPRGIILTSGKSGDADKSNICNTEQNASTNNGGFEGDPDLEQLAGVSSHDACIIEFDYKPNADTVSFNYVFASEEYHEYVNSTFNDMFGFFVSGPGIAGPYLNNAEYISLIPETSIGVAINTVNFGKGGSTCTGKPSGCINCEWFKDNSQNTDPAFSKFVYDGLTKPLVAKHGVKHGQWFHLKIAISDGGDAIYDSAVLLEKDSFFTGHLKAIVAPHIMK